MADTPPEFLGRGWAFPVALAGPDGTVARAAYQDSIEQAIWLILSTAKGERPMRPDFGCGIHDLVFALNDATTAGRVTEEVRDALALWEPRVELQDVSVTSDQPGVLAVRIAGQVRATNARFNLVYPFYLTEDPQA
jgi:uncharacterized protein